MAAKLYFDGRVKYIITSGGVKWEHEGQSISEAQGLALFLKKHGVPEEAIIIENEATTTMENMIYGTLQMCRKFGTIGLFNVKSAIVVTSPWHLRRSICWAKNILPRSIKVSGYTHNCGGGSSKEWNKTQWFVDRVDMEVMLLKDMIEGGVTEDIEF